MAVLFVVKLKSYIVLVFAVGVERVVCKFASGRPVKYFAHKVLHFPVPAARGCLWGPLWEHVLLWAYKRDGCTCTPCWVFTSCSKRCLIPCLILSCSWYCCCNCSRTVSDVSSSLCWLLSISWSEFQGSGSLGRVERESSSSWIWGPRSIRGLFGPSKKGSAVSDCSDILLILLSLNW